MAKAVTPDDEATQLIAHQRVIREKLIHGLGKVVCEFRYGGRHYVSDGTGMAIDTGPAGLLSGFSGEDVPDELQQYSMPRLAPANAQEEAIVAAYADLVRRRREQDSPILILRKETLQATLMLAEPLYRLESLIPDLEFGLDGYSRRKYRLYFAPASPRR